MVIKRSRIIYIFLFIISAVILLVNYVHGILNQSELELSIATFLAWFAVLSIALCKEERNIIHIFFLITFFVFLLSKPFVRLITSGEIYAPFCYETMLAIYSSLIISLAGLGVGIMFSYPGNTIIYKLNHKGSKINYALLQQITFILTLICGFAQVVIAFEKIVFFMDSGSTVGALRTDFFSTLPYIIVKPSNIYILMLCIFLATLPNKKKTSVAFVQYLIIGALKMAYGSRSEFVLGIMAMCVYYIMRGRMGKKDSNNMSEIWFGKLEKTIAISIVPILIFMMVAIGYYRTGKTFVYSGVVDTFVEFFDSQGISINVIGYAFENKDKLPQPNFLFLVDNTYTFLTTNPVSSWILGKKFYSSNTIERALYGTSLEQSLYYLVNSSSYLNGFGCGSSYVAELLVGYGFAGCFVFNIFFAKVMNKLYYLRFDSIIRSTIGLIFLLSLFFIPRTGFDEFVSEFASVTHFTAIFLIWVLYKLIDRKKG